MAHGEVRLNQGIKMKKISIVSLIGLAVSTQSFAAKINIEADDVIVTTYRVRDSIQNIPANVQVITRQDIQEINSTSIPQILSQLGGLNITGTALGQFNQGASVDIGGYGATASSTTLILINGQRISPIDSSATPWEIIPVASIDRIEIIKGGAGVQYGDRAVGGVINIVTNESQQSINQASANLGSFGTRGASAIFQNKYNDTLLKVSGNANHSDGWRQNTASDQYSVDARITQFFDKNSVYLEFFGNHNKNETPGAVIAPIGQGNSKSVKCDLYTCFTGAYNQYNNYGIGLGTVYELNNRFIFEGDLSYRNTESDFNQPWGTNYNAPAPSPYTPYNSDYNRWRVDFSPRFKMDLSKLGNLIVGYDYSRSHGATNGTDSFTGYTYTTESSASLTDNSFYFSHKLSLQENLDLLTGFRRQVQNISANDGWHDSDGFSSSVKADKTTSANAWELGLNYKFSESQKAYAKYSQSFRFPNLDEFWGYQGFTRTFFGGIIVPQIDRTAQIGAEFVIGNTKFTPSIFNTRTEHEIRYQVATGKNINDENIVDRNGIHLSTASLVTDRLSFYTNSKLQEAIYAGGQYNGKSFDLVPHLLVNARLTYKLDNDWSFGFVTNYVGSQYYDGANDKSAYTKMPSYIVSDLYASKKIDHWDLRVTLKNVANEHYATYGGYQDKGASFYKGYYYYPSDPRSVFASVNYNF
jgi:iron complex outermembrane receptor protein